MSDGAFKLPVDFVFLDARPWPYAVKLHADGAWWLYRWLDGPKNFVTLWRISTEEALGYRAYALPLDQAKLYFQEQP